MKEKQYEEYREQLQIPKAKKDELIGKKIDKIKKFFNIDKLNEIDRLLKTDDYDYKVDRLLKTEHDNVKKLKNKYNLDVDKIKSVLKKKQYEEYRAQLGILKAVREAVSEQDDEKKDELIRKIDEIKTIFNIDKLDKIERLLNSDDDDDDKVDRLLNSDDDNVKILQKEFKLEVKTIKQVLKEKQYGQYKKQLGILNEKEQEVRLNKKMHTNDNQYDERAKQWVDFFNIFIDRHYTTVSQKI